MKMRAFLVFLPFNVCVLCVYAILIEIVLRRNGKKAVFTSTGRNKRKLPNTLHNVRMVMLIISGRRHFKKLSQTA